MNIELPSLKTILKNISENQNNVEWSSDDSKNEKKFNIVFSGVRDKEKETYYLNQGYEISDNVNSNTKLLIVKDKNKITTKMKKALQLGVKIYSLNQL
jgi:NAD-dependent DNA ligase